VKHRHALLAALALASVIALLLVGRVRAADPGPAWTPAASDAWDYQLASGTIDLTALTEVDVYDIDAFTVKTSTVTTIHTGGKHAICYIDAGSWESYRPDAGRFPAKVLGKVVPGWPDERWLDIRRPDVLRPILGARLDRCAHKGFDGVEFDWIDGYQQHTGFAITRADQLRFDRWLAMAAHARGLAVGLKNGLGLIPDLLGRYDFAVNEQCFQYHECTRYKPFLDAGKAVFNVEYELAPGSFCARAHELGISAISKHLALGAWRQGC
jgi:hypothetical protein